MEAASAGGRKPGTLLSAKANASSVKATANANTKAKAKAKAKAVAKAKAKDTASAKHPAVVKRPAAAVSSLILGCSKCRYTVNGCGACKDPAFTGKRGHP